MRLWFRLGSNWGVSLGFWGTVLYAVGYLMFLAFVIAAVALTVIAATAIAVGGALLILIASVVAWAREGGRFGTHASPRFRAAWARVQEWADRR